METIAARERRRVACIGTSFWCTLMHSTSAGCRCDSIASVRYGRNVFGGEGEDLFLDRSKTIFRSGLPTGSLTLTYVPTSSWTSQEHCEDRWTIRRISRKTHGRQEMCNARDARHTFWPLIWIFDIQSPAAKACLFITNYGIHTLMMTLKARLTFNYSHKIVLCWIIYRLTSIKHSLGKKQFSDVWRNGCLRVL